MKVVLDQFWATLKSLCAYDVYMCGADGAEERKCAPHCSGKQNPRGPEDAKNTKKDPSRGILGLLCGHFGVNLHTLGSLWGHFVYMKVTLESLWSVF